MSKRSEGILKAGTAPLRQAGEGCKMLLEELLVNRPAGGKGRMGIKVWALATDGDADGTVASIYTDQKQMYLDLAARMGTAEEITEAQELADTDQIEALADYVTEIEPPMMFTYSIDEREIEIPAEQPKEQPESIIARLESIFPWLRDDGEQQISGADTIDDLQQFYYGLKLNYPNPEEDQFSHRGRDGFCAKCAGDCQYDSDGKPKEVKP
jgi:hypothetical protein